MVTMAVLKGLMLTSSGGANVWISIAVWLHGNKSK